MLIKRYLHSGWLIFNILVATLIIGLILMTFGLLDKNRHLLKRLEYYWGNWIIKSSFIPITVTGLENLDINQQYIFSSNHASLYTLPGAQKVREKFSVSLITKNDIFY